MSEILVDPGFGSSAINSDLPQLRSALLRSKPNDQAEMKYVAVLVLVILAACNDTPSGKTL